MDAQKYVEALLRSAGVPQKGTYRPGEACAVLGVSERTLRRMRAEARIETIIVRSHPRVPHRALVDAVARKQEEL